jgi:hypothetical protein
MQCLVDHPYVLLLLLLLLQFLTYNSDANITDVIAALKADKVTMHAYALASSNTACRDSGQWHHSLALAPPASFRLVTLFTRNPATVGPPSNICMCRISWHVLAQYSIAACRRVASAAPASTAHSSDATMCWRSIAGLSSPRQHCTQQ